MEVDRVVGRRRRAPVRRRRPSYRTPLYKHPRRPDAGYMEKIVVSKEHKMPNPLDLNGYHFNVRPFNFAVTDGTGNMISLRDNA